MNALDGHKPSLDIGTIKMRVEEEKAAWGDELYKISNLDAEVMHPRRALLELSKAIPDNATIVTDIGNVADGERLLQS